MAIRVLLGTKYHVIADVLRERITVGVYPPGVLLPSELSLSFDFGCSRDTVRDALDVLRTEGLVVKARGRRAVVAPIAERTTVMVTPGSTVTARMPLRPELTNLGCRAEIPLFVVTHPDGAVAIHPADRVLLAAVAFAPKPDTPT
jgi:GntR family transcriptional regulator